MLLYIEQPYEMQQIALAHLIDRFNATRADIGFGSPSDLIYQPCAARHRLDCSVPEISGYSLPNREPGLQIVWQSGRAVQIDTAHDPISRRLKSSIEELRIRVKIARRLQVADRPFGIVCVDQTEDPQLWGSRDIAYFDLFVASVLSPLVAESLEHPSGLNVTLTAAERAVAELAARGLSYKSIAKVLEKSPNTVDNQLRSIRAKLGAHNQIEMIRALDLNC
ncbi:helix-turn-helix transcriptional regulator [Bradyrhizobium sp. CCBAU 53338]|uniref:helix-turn-helix transcriptional regulator n=1 Tax=Bradyrhizobium sp. CCBAU 53338 TaxID=1325111 RepID=UPI00188DA896|nr:helix-turn-helix transcriptional regulator [Bradyrhizobium sp. CCBAU 53338]